MRGSAEDVDIPSVPVALIPVIVFPDEGAGEAMIDSTFQIRRLEKLFPSRSMIPPDPALAFLDALLEDYADEWLTKPMFHYRWKYAADIDKASHVLGARPRSVHEPRAAGQGVAFFCRSSDRTAPRGRLERRDDSRNRGELPPPARAARSAPGGGKSIPHGRAAGASDFGFSAS